MKLQIMRFFSLLYFLLFSLHLHGIDSNASQHLSFSHPSFLKLQNEIERLTEEIKRFDGSKSSHLLIDRGILLFFIGDYESALNDFNYVLDIQLRNFSFDNGITAQALWGRTLSHAFLEKREAFFEDLSYIAELIKTQDDCPYASSSYPQKLFCALETKELNPLLLTLNDPLEKDILLCGVYCEKSVDYTAKLMKAMCHIIRDRGIKSKLFLFIDGLADKAKNCCRAGGIWKECIAPMVKVADKWKIFGIPSDS